MGFRKVFKVQIVGLVMVKPTIFKSKFYAVNPYTKKIKRKAFDRAKDIDWKYRGENIKKVHVGRKGDVIKRLLKKGFKFS